MSCSRFKWTLSGGIVSSSVALLLALCVYELSSLFIPADHPISGYNRDTVTFEYQYLEKDIVSEHAGQWETEIGRHPIRSRSI